MLVGALFCLLVVAWFVLLGVLLVQKSLLTNQRIFSQILLTIFLILIAVEMDGEDSIANSLHIVGGAWLASFFASYLFYRQEHPSIFLSVMLAVFLALSWEALEMLATGVLDDAEAQKDVLLSGLGALTGATLTVFIPKTQNPPA